MKKTTFSILFLALFLYADAIPILGLKKDDKGIFGYNYVDFNRVQFTDNDGNQRWGWVGECLGRGFTQCKTPKSEGIALNNNPEAEEADHYDIDRAEELIEDAEQLIVNGQNSGTLNATFQVNGQNFSRHYVLTWSQNSNGEYLFDAHVDYLEL